MTIRMDEGAAELLDTLHRAGYAAYVVGGCVRDSLLGLTPHDWDLCTSALPQQGMELFGAEKCIPTGLQHGTVTVKQGGGLYEITTFRTEGAYTDGRHPDEVHFVPDVREDLARRDFTINAMAYNAKEGLIDPFGGQADLQSGVLRAVGVPHQRFTEDALRILRLYRFAARFGFSIDPPTAQAAQELCAHLDCVSVERIEEELAKLLSAPAPAAYLDEKILGVVLPELSPEALAAAKPVVDACPAGERALPVRLAALLLSLGEDGIRRTLRRLRCSNACIEETAVLVREARGRDGSFSEDRPLGWDPVARRAIGRAMEWPESCPRRKLPAALHKQHLFFHLLPVPCGKQLCGLQAAGRVLPAARLRHRVVAPFAEGIAPGDAPCSQQDAFDAPMGHDGLHGVVAAAGRKTAAAADPRAQGVLIHPDQPA